MRKNKMEQWRIILLIMFLFMTILMTLANISRLIYKSEISAMNFLLWAIGLTGIITILWII